MPTGSRLCASWVMVIQLVTSAINWWTHNDQLIIELENTKQEGRIARFMRRAQKEQPGLSNTSIEVILYAEREAPLFPSIL